MKGSLDVTWNHGTPGRRGNGEPKIQVHYYDEHTVILRQSKSVSYEAPFLYLLFGNDRALLLDTGATADPERFPLREKVDRLVAVWLAKYPREGYELVVAHTHGHGDHVAADGQFAGRAGTTVVAKDVDAVRLFFGFGDGWPDRSVSFDLGGRCWRCWARRATTGRRSPSTTRGPPSCSPATPSIPGGCTCPTSPRSWPRWTAWSPSPEPGR
jgi:hypothetical protein